MANPRHKVAPLVQLFRHHFWLRSILLIATLSIDFCFDLGEQFEPSSWDISDSENDQKDFFMASQMAEKELSESKPQSSDR